MNRLHWFLISILGASLLSGCGNDTADAPSEPVDEPVGQSASVGSDHHRFPAPRWPLSENLVQPFKEICAQRILGADAGAFQGMDSWLFLRSELSFCSSDQFWNEEDETNPLPVIVDFAEQLRERGVELWLLPVPAKAAVYPEQLDSSLNIGEQERLDALMVRWIEVLRGAGVEVIDLMEPFLAQKASSERALYCRTDSHWSGNACEITASLLAVELRKLLQLEWNDAGEYSAEKRDIEIRGDLAGMIDGDVIPAEAINLRFVSKSGVPPEEDRSSPVLLMGDSHVLVFHSGGDMHAVGAGLADQLAFELGMGIDLLGVRGSGATPARISLMRRMRSDQDYLAGKRVVIWCFSAREFTEADGWRMVPLP